jgi:hypothetical protein
MPFRIGLLIDLPTAQSSDLTIVQSLLKEIDERTDAIRGGESLTLLPFLRNRIEADTCLSAAGDAEMDKAATWNEAGVVFGSFEDLRKVQHAQRNSSTDRVHEFEALASSSHVIVIVCSAASKFHEWKKLLQTKENTWTHIALISLHDKQKEFYEICPTLDQLDQTGWLIGLTACWQSARPDLGVLPLPKRSGIGLIFPLLTSAIIRRRFENLKKSPKSNSERCRGGLGLSSKAMEKLARNDQKQISGNLEAICPFFIRHDDLGKVYSNLFRTTCLLVPFFIATSTVAAVAAVIEPLRHNSWHVVEATLLTIAALFVFTSKLAEHHSKWVQHRLTAELMRSTILCNLMHSTPQMTLPSEDPGRWAAHSRVVWTYIRSLPILTFESRAADLLSARCTAVVDYATYQEKFHNGFAAQHQAAHKWLTNISGLAFWGTLCLVVFQLVTAYLPGDARLSTKLMMATIIAACGAFVLSLITHQLGFEAIAERSTNAAQRLRALRALIDQHAHSAKASDVYGWGNDCGRLILDEQHSWYRHIPFIRMHL